MTAPKSPAKTCRCSALHAVPIATVMRDGVHVDGTLIVTEDFTKLLAAGVVTSRRSEISAF